MPPSPSGASYAFWLLPQEPLRSILRALIDRLADMWDAKPFEPHVTVHGGFSSHAEALAIGTDTVRRYGRIELIAEGLRQSNLFTKTFFIQFTPSAALRDMFLTIQNAMAKDPDYELNPHLSLLYQAMPEAARRELCLQTEIPKTRYLFDALRVVHIPAPITHAGAVGAWSTVFEAKLEGC